MEELDQEYHIQIAIRTVTSQNDQDRNPDVETGGNGVGEYNFINCETETNYVSDFLSNLQAILNKNEHGDDRTENPSTSSDEIALPGNQSDVNHTISNVPFKYKCVPCGKRFVTQAGLSSHKRSHCPRQGVMCPIESQPFWCKTCRKRFPTHQQFVQHKTLHPLAKGYVCQICGKHFTTISSLTYHNILHTREKLFKCRTCRKGCISLSSLSSHEWLHTRGKPFKCDTCNLCYGSSGGLINHKRQKHPPTP